MLLTQQHKHVHIEKKRTDVYPTISVPKCVFLSAGCVCGGGRQCLLPPRVKGDSRRWWEVSRYPQNPQENSTPSQTLPLGSSLRVLPPCCAHLETLREECVIVFVIV